MPPMSGSPFADFDRDAWSRLREDTTLPLDATELEEIAAKLRLAAGAGASPLTYPELLVNDLEAAARSLRPEIGDALDALREAGAPLAILSGSGPTAVGLFESVGEAHAAAAGIDRDDAIVCEAGRAP